MNLLVKNTPTLNGKATVPASKSETIRAIILALLANGESTLGNALDASDTHDAIELCQQLGANVQMQHNKITLTSHGLPLAINTNKLYSGNSGITTRFMLPALGLRANTKEPVTFDSGEQMRQRPIHPLLDVLQALGLQINYLQNKNALPISVSGQLQGGKVSIDGATSQYLSALLLQLPCARGDSEITVKDLQERPYVEMTLNCLKKHGIDYTHQQHDNNDVFNIKGQQNYKPLHTHIDGDFSSASYLIAAATMLPGTVKLNGLNRQSAQGDKQLIAILQKMGADIQIAEAHLLIKGGNPLQGITIDANDIPDLLPTLAVLGTYAQGRTKIINVKHARIKETDRIHSMSKGLIQLGAHVETLADSMVIAQSKLRGAKVNGYDDHRTVMALSVAGLLAQGETVITGSEAINKTYPTYVQTMQSLGAIMEVKNV